MKNSFKLTTTAFFCVFAALNLQAGGLVVSTNSTVYNVDDLGNATVYATGFTGARGLSYGANGDLFVADFGANKIVKVSGGVSSDFASVAHPYGLLYNGTDLFVSQFQSGASLLELDSTGALVSSVSTGYGNLTEIAFGTGGDLLIGSGSAHGVIRDSGGVFSLLADTSANGASVFGNSISTPRGIFLRGDNLYVADSGSCSGGGCYNPNNNIQVFDAATGSYLNSISTGGGNPQGLLYDSVLDLMYVARNTGGDVAQIDFNVNAVSTFSSIAGTHSIIASSATPEPASALLLLAGLGSATFLRKRRKA